jgi:transposase-like protein
VFTQDKADAICELLADGASLRKAAAEIGVSAPTVLRWCEENPAFAEQYASARARGYQLLADEIIEISDDASGDVVETEQGPRVDAERVARSKLRVDSRKWMLAKMLPKVYGDKLDLNHGGAVRVFASPLDEQI